jgi:hypothetical protein
VVAQIANYVAAAGGFAAIGMLVWLAARGDRERIGEDDARAFFDRHGRWPDEPPEAAVPRAGGYADVDAIDS